ncbi:MAG: ABC transporter ATP-binding protein [Methanomassiliicoccales archaeon]|jgi:ABC-type Fe3+/spermidine/putrescine transport system ATPase subunit|nr:ABC transporter ATP-binding protein [Methanomassiliicoccales archaeon]
MPTVELRNVTMKWGRVTAAEDVNLRIEDREYVTILGPSGCGKTTLVKIIAGIFEPSSGEVFIDGKNMRGVPIEERDIGYVFQNIALFPHLDVYDNVAYGLRVKGADQEELEKIPRQYLDLVKLLDKMKMFPPSLCGGEQQKVSLARALSTGAKLLLLDEPLSALDARVRVDLRYELRRLVKSLGLTALHVTHDQEEAMSVSDRIVVMRSGRIVEIGTPMKIYTRPQNIFTANFIGETNLLEGWVTRTCENETEVELRDGTAIVASSSDFREGDAVVVSIRPENLFSSEHGIEAVITDMRYIGTFIRVIAKARTEETIEFDIPTSKKREYNIGDEIHLSFEKDSALVFARGPGGIEEAISLE